MTCIRPFQSLRVGISVPVH